MANNKKRPKYITDMVNHANAYLRKHNHYQGFNLYKKHNLNGIETIILTDIEHYEFIQLC